MWNAVAPQHCYHRSIPTFCSCVTFLPMLWDLSPSQPCSQSTYHPHIAGRLGGNAMRTWAHKEHAWIA